MIFLSFIWKSIYERRLYHNLKSPSLVDDLFSKVSISIILTGEGEVYKVYICSDFNPFSSFDVFKSSWKLNLNGCHVHPRALRSESLYYLLSN